jgi:hypothetical protein
MMKRSQVNTREDDRGQQAREPNMNHGFIVGTALAAMLVCICPAGAQNLDSRLRGTYAVTGSETCLVSFGGFNPDLTPNALSVTTATSTTGTAILNGDGTGSETDQNVSISGSPFPDGASETTSFDLTYVVDKDRTVTFSAALVNGQQLTGTLAGQTFTIVNNPPLTGKLPEDGRSFALAPTDPVIDTFTFSGGLVEQRICVRSRIASKVSGRVDSDAAE